MAGYQIVEIPSFDILIKGCVSLDVQIVILERVASTLMKDIIEQNSPIKVEVVKVMFDTSSYLALGVQYLENNNIDFGEIVEAKADGLLKENAFVSFLMTDSSLLQERTRFWKKKFGEE